MTAEMKAINGLAAKLQRRYKLPSGTNEDLVSAAMVVLQKLEGYSASYRIAAARNAAMREVRNHLPKGFRGTPFHIIHPSNLPKIVSFDDLAGERSRIPHDFNESISFIDEEKIFDLLDDLPQFQRIVVEMRIGLNGADPHKWHMLAAKLGAAVYQVQNAFEEGIEALRERLALNG